MKRFLPLILITVILAQLLAPFSIGSQSKNIFGVKENKAEAQQNPGFNLHISAIATTTDTSVSVQYTIQNNTDNTILSAFSTVRLSLVFTLSDSSGAIGSPQTISITAANTGTAQTTTFTGLTSGHAYTITGSISATTTQLTGNPYAPSITQTYNVATLTPPLAFTTNVAGNNTPTAVAGSTGISSDVKKQDSNLSCTIIPFRIGACIAQLLYWLFFKPTSALFAIAGRILDFTLMYTLSDSSYRSEFVTQGWGIIRDFCNMFFILVLLYIAVGTILDLHSVNTKKMLINVVIIGLLINFSLFATQLIIDASNILARVFYNPQTIVITQVDSTGKAIPGSNSGLGDFHEIRLSEAIVSKIDPQSIVDKASTTTDIPTKNIAGGGSDSTSTAGGGMTVGTFILIIFLCTAINIVGMIVFLSCSLIFVGRVVMLWVAMIMAPLAFFSYIVPELQSVKMIGWKSWWSDLLKMSFVAPIFVFFMYIIVAFMDKGLSVVNLSVKLSMTGFSSLIAVMVPFLFIVVLLLQSKKIAVDMSGEMGAMVSKVGAAVGGFATGALVGAGAMAMRGTIGRAGNSIANSEKLKEAEANGGIKGFGAKMLRNVGTGAGAASYDARNAPGMATAVKGLGVDVGKAKEGGFTKTKADQIAKSQKRAKELEAGPNSKAVKGLNEKEVALKKMQNEKSGELAALDGKIKAGGTDAREKIDRANLLEREVKRKGENASPEEKDAAIQARKEALKASDELQANKDKKKDIRDNTKTEVTVSKGSAEKYEKDAVDAEKTVKDAKTNVSQKIQEETTKVNEIIDKSKTDAAASVEKAKAEAAAMVTKAKTDALNAEQAKNVAFANKTAIGAKPEAEQAYQQALANHNTAQTNVSTTITSASQSVIKAQADAKASIDDITNKADGMRNQAIQRINKDIADKEKIATDKRAKADTMHEGAKVMRSMNEIEYEDIPDAHHELEHINNGRKFNQAKNLESKPSKIINYITSGGQYSASGADEAAYKIRMDAKIENHGGGSQGGGSSHAAPAAHAPAPAPAGDSHGSGNNHGGGDTHGKAHK